MRRSTYILQCVAAVLMLSACLLGHYAVVEHRWGAVAFQVLIFAVNMGLFICQQRIRYRLPPRKDF